tara:strand:+ start:156 stop:347 length:192 start_codon:yes stop_codon:yes gene_type:complete
VRRRSWKKKKLRRVDEKGEKGGAYRIMKKMKNSKNKDRTNGQDKVEDEPREDLIGWVCASWHR